MKNLKHILVGVDFSQASENGLQEAIRIARWNAAPVKVLHVVDERVLDDVRHEENKSG